MFFKCKTATKIAPRYEVRYRWIDRVSQEVRVMTEGELKATRLNGYIQILDAKAI